MAKSVLLGDMHVSLRNGDVRFVNYFRKTYEWFFDELRSRKINHIRQAGDLYDKRTGNDSYAVAQANEYFFDVIENEGFIFESLIGNHDLYFKNSDEVNSPELLLGGYKNVTIFSKPTTVGEWDFIPWINDSNRKEVFDFIKNSSSRYCIAHLEISGASMNKGTKAKDGLSPKIFEKYKRVFSGHYHTKSKIGNIQYLSIPAEYTWQDFDDPKGFWIFDDETDELEFIQNPHTMFLKLYYDDSLPVIPKEFDIGDAYFEQCTDKFVRLYVLKCTDTKLYNKFIEKINAANPHELKIVDEVISTDSNIDTENLDIHDTTYLIGKYIDEMETDLDKEKLNMMMQKLYIESQEN